MCLALCQYWMSNFNYNLLLTVDGMLWCCFLWRWATVEPGWRVVLWCVASYAGELHLNLDDVIDVLAGACHLQMHTAVHLCSRFLVSEINVKTSVDILNIADMFSLEYVKDAAFKFILTSFDRVADTPDQFLKLHKEHLGQLLESNDIACSSELALFHSVVRWIDAGEPDHKECASLLEHVRFTLMSPEELVDCVSQSKVMAADPRCRVYLDEALHYHVLPSRHPLMQTCRTQVRNTPCMVAFGGRCGANIGYKFNSSKMYALCDATWRQLPDAESSFLFAAVAVVDNFLYVCGGMGRPAHAQATCQRFDPRTGLWTQLAHMKVRRQSFPLVAYAGRLYAFGGGTSLGHSLDHPPTNCCEMYLIDSNEWRSIASMPFKYKASSASELGGNIYVSGGRTDNKTVASMWCYEPSSDSWQEKAPMLSPHAGHTTMTINGQIYVIDRVNLAIESYSPGADAWTQVTAPSMELSGVARPAVLSPWVYFISYLHHDKDSRCCRYNVLTFEFEELPPYPEQVHCVIGVPLTFPRHTLDANNNT